MTRTAEREEGPPEKGKDSIYGERGKIAQVSSCQRGVPSSPPRQCLLRFGGRTSMVFHRHNRKKDRAERRAQQTVEKKWFHSMGRLRRHPQ